MRNHGTYGMISIAHIVVFFIATYVGTEWAFFMNDEYMFQIGMRSFGNLDQKSMSKEVKENGKLHW